MRRQASCTVVTFRRYGVDNAPRDHKFPSEKGAGNTSGKIRSTGKVVLLKVSAFHLHFVHKKGEFTCCMDD